MYNIVFSIPIHEKFEVVLDLICNIRHFNPNCGIIFHLSKSFDYKNSLISKDRFLSIINNIGDIWVNPLSLRSGRNDIIQTHLANFEYIKKLIDFEYFAFTASNESFVKKGLYDYLKQYEWGAKKQLILKPEDWRFGKELFNDSVLLTNISKKTNILFSNTEGQFYKKELFSEICTKILEIYDYEKMETPYPRDEIYFTTFAGMLSNKATAIGELYTYSAYHFYYLWDANRREINKIANTNNHLFSVKRVDRKLNDNIRVYLRNKYGYKAQLQNLLGITFELFEYSNIRIDYLSYIKSKKQLLENWKKIPKYFSAKWITK